MATLGKTLPQTAVLPVLSLIRKEGALKLHGAVLLALDTLRKNPLRSALTILGIVIGITTVITVSAMINGLNDNVLAGIRELGSDTIIAYRFPWASLSRPPSEWFTRKELQPEWAEDMSKLPHVAAASPSMRIFMPQFGSGTADLRRGVYRAKNVILQGNSPSIGRIFDLKIEYGRMFNETDADHHMPVVISVGLVEHPPIFDLEVEDASDRRRIPLQDHVLGAVDASAQVRRARSELWHEDAHRGRSGGDMRQLGHVLGPFRLQFLSSKPFAWRP